MTREFDCSECGNPAFTTDNDINHHGTADEIDHDADADHVALDSDALEFTGNVPDEATRRQAADRAFAVFDFEGVQVESADGWEGVTPGTELTRTIYIASETGSPTERALYGAFSRNVASEEIIEVYAITNNGQLFGKANP